MSGSAKRTVFGTFESEFIESQVKVMVENGKAAFTIHENVLRNSSPFFDRALPGTWKEAHERTVEMPSEESEIFAIYAQWLYNNTLPCSLNSTENGQVNDDTLAKDYLTMAKVWVFGNKILDSKFQNIVVDAFLEKGVWEDDQGRTWFPTSALIAYVYNNTTTQSRLRHLLLDIGARQGCPSTLSEWDQDEEILQPFLLDLSKKLLDLLRFKKHEPLKAANYSCGIASDTKDIEVEAQASQPTKKIRR